MEPRPFERLRNAIAAVDLALVSTLIQEGADVDQPDECGITPLAHAVATGRIDIVRHLVDAGANTNQESRPASCIPELAGPSIPLLLAAVLRHRDQADYLASRTRLKLRTKAVKQFRAIKNKWNKKLLRDPRVKALLAAAESGDAASVSSLIADKADLRAGDEWGNTALAKASLYGHVEVVRLLLEAGADPDGELDAQSTPLMVASNAAIAESLIRAGADPNKLIDGATPLSAAAHRNLPDITTALLAAGANPDVATEPHGCALSTAVAKGSVDVARILIDSGASANFHPKHGWPPLMYAASSGREALVSMLLSAGADVHFRDDDGDTPLSVAKGHPRIIDLLHNAGARIQNAS